MRLLLIWVVNAIALMLLAYFMPAVEVHDFKVALCAALVLGLVNTLIRPVFVWMTLPVTVLSLGLFLLVINGAMFMLADKLVDGFHVDGLLNAVLAALLYSLISWLLQALLGVKKD